MSAPLVGCKEEIAARRLAVAAAGTSTELGYVSGSYRLTKYAARHAGR
ncbi:MAG: hypothetical protein MZV49_09960 [Rhodopseudomonas palustris]|nr:hypothetical protein [Rhodopseudomonas palustris]